MTVKIETFPASGARPVASSGPAKSANAIAGESSSGAVSAVSANDRVQLTGDAVNLQQFEKALAAVPRTDAGKVERLRAAVDNGSYQPNPAAIAAKLARFEYAMA
ncbi:flagellar biosynthesis anti-sigma factor FlgM [Nevskia ramosa]|uniref:flagellar biosynthesis anti-sigma factor FlgM n=2 Tax=Nevskia ramosa TaxID=64002 RepID=UPI0003B34D18|nr:flagellar biosynthesis anti-sigma factor FlgM [Nevskia ramosa]